MNMKAAQSLRARIAGVPADAAIWRVLRAGFDAVAGAGRVLIYDLRREEAPDRLSRTGVALKGSPRWLAYLDRRRRLDDGGLSLVFALRRLGQAERLLVVDWGTAHANTFLLIEPLDPEADLSDGRDPTAQALRAAAEAGARSDDPSDVEAVLRRAYASWVYWPDSPATEDGFCRQDLPLSEDSATLFQRLRAEALPEVFPPSAFDRQLSRLIHFESELFVGRSVERACSPFLTRLGLPTVYEPSLVTGALRRMVNEGRLSAYVVGGHGSFQGPEAPVPDEVPDELFERMLL